MNKADFGALKCQAACSTGIYIFCPSNRKGDIVFERIKLTANSIHSLKSSAVAHANTLWSRVATAIQQKREDMIQPWFCQKCLVRHAASAKNVELWESGTFFINGGKELNHSGSQGKKLCQVMPLGLKSVWEITAPVFFPFCGTFPLFFFPKVTQF